MSVRVSVRSIDKAARSFKFVLLGNDQQNCRHIHTRIRISRDVRYSDLHDRNVLDIYEPHAPTGERGSARQFLSSDRPPTLLFVHGGMWMRGSKEQSVLSPWDVTSSSLKGLLGGHEKGSHTHSPNYDIPGTSNIGVTIGAHGGVALIINYRLVGRRGTTKERLGEISNDGKFQAIDIARSIAFAVEHEMKQRQEHDSAQNHEPNLFVCGHSAGAHLAAVALCHPSYLRKAMEERDMSLKTLYEVLAGYIGISGVYNLRRLGMGMTKDITVGPAFLQRNLARPAQNVEDILTEFSPVHMLLRSHAEIASEKNPTSNYFTDSVMPPMAKIPTLLLNAESDFHLEQDAKELVVALGQFDFAQCMSTVEHETIMSSDHLSIMRQFGADIEQLSSSSDYIHLQKKKGLVTPWGFESVFGSQFEQAVCSAASLVGFSVGECDKDETSRRVMKFMNKQ